jgi:hypothetical protein
MDRPPVSTASASPRRRIVHIPAHLVVEPPGILRMRKSLAEGKHHNPDADLPPLHGPLSADLIKRFRTKAS